MPELVPAILERKIVPTVWGGRALQEVLGIPLPPDATVGESWELYDRPDGSSRLRDHDATVHDLLEQDPSGLLGRGVEPNPEGRFPLALKFLDAATALSVQVHPDDEQAAEDGGSGKTEAWVVIRAGARARVARGFRRGVTRERFTEVAHTERVMELLEVFAPAEGSAVHVPAGTVHTLGPDVLVFEIQRNSSLTYRIFDWERSREQHLQQGLRAARFDVEPETTVAPVPIPGGGEWVVRDPHFGVRRFTFEGPRAIATEGRFAVLTLLSGRAVVGWKSQGRHDPLVLGTAESVLVPACIEEVFVSPVGEACLLVSDPGGDR